MKYSGAILIFLALSAGLIAEPDYLWPLNTEHQLTRSFAEFRVGHFHAGIDLRTPDGEGMPIIAPADGDVVRVRETPWGYGRVIYYRFGGDSVAVFAHLSAFQDSIARAVSAEKYRKRSNSAELWLSGGELPFSAGDTIGFSGSSGAGSPHLHFELRDGFENAINPMASGFITKDEMPPKIVSLWIIPRGNDSEVQGSFSPRRIPVSGDSLRVKARGEMGLALEFYDRESQKNGNRFGVYSITVSQGDSLVYEYRADGFSYSRTRQIGLLYDLPLQEEFELGRPPFRLDRPPGADTRLVRGPEGCGVLDIDRETAVRIIARDFVGNADTLVLKLVPTPERPVYPLTVETAADSSILLGDIPAGDSCGLRLEYYTSGDSREVPIPGDGGEIALPGDAEYVELTSDKFDAPLWFWRPADYREPEIDIRLFGSSEMIIRANFPGPPPSMPVLKRGDILIPPEMEGDTSCLYRVHNPSEEDEYSLSVSGHDLPIDPGLKLVRGDQEIELVKNYRLEIPEGGIFVPFYIRAEFEVDSAGGEFLRLDPPGVVLRRAARLVYTGELPDSVGYFLARFWRGDTLFAGAGSPKLSASISAFGEFGIARDTVPPEIGLPDSGAVVRTKIFGSLEEDLSGFNSSARLESIVDSAWIPTDFDPEVGSIQIDVSQIPSGEHTWRVTASDAAGNISEESVKFIIRRD